MCNGNPLSIEKVLTSGGARTRDHWISRPALKTELPVFLGMGVLELHCLDGGLVVLQEYVSFVRTDSPINVKKGTEFEIEIYSRSEATMFLKL